MSDAKEILKEIFTHVLRTADPYRAVIKHAEEARNAFADGGYEKLICVACGKGAVSMGGAAEEIFGDRISAGLAVTKYGHTAGAESLRRFEVLEAGHPLPDENGARAAERVMTLLTKADERTFVFFLISGGGSALLVSPLDSVTLDEKRAVTRKLLECGATINEMNAVRKHLSKVKGGRLAKAAWPATVLSFIVSDVIGDPLDVISSGPTAPDESTFSDAISILGKYGIAGDIPESIVQTLARGTLGAIPETPKPGDEIFHRVKNVIIFNNPAAISAAAEKGRQLGLNVVVRDQPVCGEAREAGYQLARSAQETSGDERPLLMVSGGETTVTVRGNGTGGRNAELALAYATIIAGTKGITFLSAGTDGNDGPTDAAGAIVDEDTIPKAKALGLSPLSYLDNNDSYTFMKAVGDILITGMSGTNVMDVQLALIE